MILELPPHHLVDDAGVALDNLHDLGAHVFFDVVGHGDAVVAVGIHRHCGVDGLQEGLFVDAGDEEACLVKRFGAFRAGANADSGERVADAREKGTFFGQGAAVAHDGKRIHLQAVVVMESEGFVLNHAFVKFETACSQTVTAARVTTVKNRHVVLFGHFVDGGKEAREVLFGVNVFFAVGAEQNVLALFEAEAGVNVARFNLREVLVQNFGHRAAGHVRAFLGQAAVSEVAAGVFGIGHVHIADDVHDAAVGLFGQALVLATVARFHVENRDVQALGRDGGKTAVGVAENQQCIGLAGNHELVAAIDDVADGCAEIVTDGIHVDFGILEAQVLEEHAVQVVIVVLTGVCENAVKVLAALVDDSREADDFWARTHDNQKFQLAVVGKFHVGVVCFNLHNIFPRSCSFEPNSTKATSCQVSYIGSGPSTSSGTFAQDDTRYFTTFSPNVSGWFGSKDSFAHMTVTKFSVSDKLMILCV